MKSFLLILILEEMGASHTNKSLSNQILISGLRSSKGSVEKVGDLDCLLELKLSRGDLEVSPSLMQMYTYV